MAAPDINIDRVVDYRAEYGQYIKRIKISGDQLTGVCPFHDDTKDSFSANLKDGRWYCFTEAIGGNFIDFIAKIEGIDTKEAYKKILDRYGMLKENEPQEEKKPQGLGSFTVEEYAFSKRLPVEFLKGTCGVETAKDKNKTSYLKIPYFNEEGTSSIYRKRYAHKEFRWSYGSSGKLILYGDWRLPKIREAGWAILVEGESDTQTLWHLGFPALGIPGAANFKPKMVPKLQDLKLYIHVEPDAGGATFLAKITRILRENEFIGSVYKFSCNDLGAKDPSELYLLKGDNEKVKALLSQAISAAELIDLSDLKDSVPSSIKDAPVNLRQPTAWFFDEEGIRHIDSKTGAPSMVCKTPVLITRRLSGLESGEEKVEIAFKRDGKWRSGIFPRSTIFTARGITMLGDMGCTVTSENAKPLVRFLAALEEANMDIIEKVESTGRMGWKPGGRFLPAHGGDIVLDVEPSMRGWADAYGTSGRFEVWRDLVSPHRDRDKFRFILAAGFTAPLLRIISQRIFFVYNWGGSRGGKTAALKAALSIWGDPEKLMVNFNATQVALERMAGFFNDLPIGIDERQLAGNKQEGIESLIYMIGSGTGRARGSKSGGLQALNTWRTVAIATGEEPLSTDTSQTGVSTRVLEIYGGPFDDEREASLMHQLLTDHHGWAGPEFIRRLLMYDEDSIRRRFEDIQDAVSKSVKGMGGSHIAGVSAVALADALAEDWLFNPAAEEEPDNGVKRPLRLSDAARTRAIAMADAVIKEQPTGREGDVNENATQYIVDWILSNSQYFGDKAVGTCLGYMGDSGKKAYIYPTILNQMLSRAGFSPRKTIRYLADQGIIATSTKADGTKVNSVTKWLNGKTIRMVEFDLGRFISVVDPLDEDAAAAALGIGQTSQIDNDDFTSIDDDDQIKLPF